MQSFSANGIPHNTIPVFNTCTPVETYIEKRTEVDRPANPLCWSRLFFSLLILLSPSTVHISNTNRFYLHTYGTRGPTHLT